MTSRMLTDVIQPVTAAAAGADILAMLGMSQH